MQDSDKMKIKSEWRVSLTQCQALLWGSANALRSIEPQHMLCWYRIQYIHTIQCQEYTLKIQYSAQIRSCDTILYGANVNTFKCPDVLWWYNVLPRILFCAMMQYKTTLWWKPVKNKIWVNTAWSKLMPTSSGIMSSAAAWFLFGYSLDEVEGRTKLSGLGWVFQVGICELEVDVCDKCHVCPHHSCSLHSCFPDNIFIWEIIIWLIRKI